MKITTVDLFGGISVFQTTELHVDIQIEHSLEHGNLVVTFYTKKGVLNDVLLHELEVWGFLRESGFMMEFYSITFVVEDLVVWVGEEMTKSVMTLSRLKN